MHFNEAYEARKSSELQTAIYEVSKEWGINEVIFEKTVAAYSTASPEEIPYIEDITGTIDYQSIGV